ncbi:hypothetical protein D3C80_864640 [compost metagenome]
MQQFHRQANHPGMVGIKTVEHQIFAFQQHHQQRNASHQQRLLQLCVGNAQHIAEQNVAEVLIGIDTGKQHQAKGKHAGENDPHHRVLFHPAVFFQVTGSYRTENTGEEGAYHHRDAEHERHHDTGQHRMRDGVTHQRPAFEHQIAREHRTHHAGHDGGQDCPLHKGIGEGLAEQLIQGFHQWPPVCSRATRRLDASSPCLGAKKKAARNTSVCRVTITPPVAPSRKKLR